ncbi:Uncharacterised protein [Klebsiella pneumoniae]|nr:Uncharacterised protein [Klebsiella pneumoniae]VGL57017.1 Uncharacterised protein [Klebsiella pneumoniae]
MLFRLLLMNNGRLAIIRLLMHNSGFLMLAHFGKWLSSFLGVLRFGFHHFFMHFSHVLMGGRIAVLHHFMGHCGLIVTAHIHHFHALPLNCTFFSG